MKYTTHHSFVPLPLPVILNLCVLATISLLKVYRLSVDGFGLSVKNILNQ